MWKCGNCGTVNSSGGHCGVCGTRLPAENAGTAKVFAWVMTLFVFVLMVVLIQRDNPSYMIQKLGEKGYRVYGPFPEDRDR